MACTMSTKCTMGYGVNKKAVRRVMRLRLMRLPVRLGGFTQACRKDTTYEGRDSNETTMEKKGLTTPNRP